MPKFDCNLFNHFPCMYVGLIVRDECERSVKTQASKNVQVDFVTDRYSMSLPDVKSGHMAICLHLSFGLLFF